MYGKVQNKYQYTVYNENGIRVMFWLHEYTFVNWHSSWHCIGWYLGRQQLRSIGIKEIVHEKVVLDWSLCKQ